MKLILKMLKSPLAFVLSVVWLICKVNGKSFKIEEISGEIFLVCCIAGIAAEFYKSMVLKTSALAIDHLFAFCEIWIFGFVIAAAWINKLDVTLPDVIAMAMIIFDGTLCSYNAYYMSRKRVDATIGGPPTIV